MTIAEPLKTGFLPTLNPLAKLGSCLVVTAVLIVSIDPVSAAVALGCECVVLGVCGIAPGALMVRIAPILVAAPLAGLTTTLYGRTSGTVYVNWWAIEISSGSLQLGLATMLRVLAIGVPAVALLMTTDVTELADSLAQIARLPARFVIGALAGLRLVDLFAEDWRALTLARRARGVGEPGSLRGFVGQAFTIFVLSLRRSAKLATAMEARGFGSNHPRTWARPSIFRARDWATLVVAALIGVLSATVAMKVGAWNVLGS